MSLAGLSTQGAGESIFSLPALLGGGRAALLWLERAQSQPYHVKPFGNLSKCQLWCLSHSPSLYYYGLSVCVPPKFIMLKPYTPM